MSVLIGVILLVLALFLLVVGALAVTRRLPGNSVIGIRVPEVRKSRETWEGAHRMAGPLWVFSGVVLVFGALISFISSGWMWVLPAVTVLVAVVGVASGANIGARTATVLEAQRRKEEGAGGCSGCSAEGGCGCGGGDAAPAPEVDLDAVMRAAEADNTRN